MITDITTDIITDIIKDMMKDMMIDTTMMNMIMMKTKTIMMMTLMDINNIFIY